jgi:hypothetical protein
MRRSSTTRHSLPGRHMGSAVLCTTTCPDGSVSMVPVQRAAASPAVPQAESSGSDARASAPSSGSLVMLPRRVVGGESCRNRRILNVEY